MTIQPMTDTELLTQFADCTLPFDLWTHRTHVRVGFLYLRDHGFDEGLTRLRADIKAYNAANDVPDGPTTGYNETTTHAFLQLIHVTMQAYGDMMPAADSESFCDTHPQLLCSQVLRLFYSPTRRRHPAAKAQFVQPDLAPLPTLQATE